MTTESLNRMLRMISTGDSTDLNSQELEIVYLLKQQASIAAETEVPKKILSTFPTGEDIIQTFENLNRGKQEAKTEYLALNYVYFNNNELFKLYAKTFYNGMTMPALKNITEAMEFGMSSALARNEKMGGMGGVGDYIILCNFIDILTARGEIPDNLKAAIQQKKYPFINKIIRLLNSMVEGILKDEYIQTGGSTYRLIDFFANFISAENQSLVMGVKENMNIILEKANVRNISEGLAIIATSMNKNPYNTMTRFITPFRTLGDDEEEGGELSRNRKALTLTVDQNQALKTYLYSRFNWGV